MAPLPENNTTIWYIDYSNAVAEHTTQIRTEDAATVGDIETFWESFIDAFDGVGGLFFLSTVLRVRRQARNTNFSLPVSSTLDGTTFGANAANNTGNTQFLTFVGRSSGGRRAAMRIFGYQFAIPQDFRLTTGESAPVEGAVEALNDQEGVGIGIDGLPVTWYLYANVGSDAYWQRAKRS